MFFKLQFTCIMDKLFLGKTNPHHIYAAPRHEILSNRGSSVIVVQQSHDILSIVPLSCDENWTCTFFAPRFFVVSLSCGCRESV